MTVKFKSISQIGVEYRIDKYTAKKALERFKEKKVFELLGEGKNANEIEEIIYVQYIHGHSSAGKIQVAESIVEQFLPPEYIAKKARLDGLKSQAAGEPIGDWWSAADCYNYRYEGKNISPRQLEKIKQDMTVRVTEKAESLGLKDGDAIAEYVRRHYVKAAHISGGRAVPCITHCCLMKSVCS